MCMHAYVCMCTYVVFVCIRFTRMYVAMMFAYFHRLCLDPYIYIYVQEMEVSLCVRVSVHGLVESVVNLKQPGTGFFFAFGSGLCWRAAPTMLVNKMMSPNLLRNRLKCGFVV